MALALSILALLATFYQAYMQRIHNEKSVKPLVQINLTDKSGLIYVHIRNNGIGPFIVEKLTFLKGDQVYYTIKDCLALNPREYQSISVSDAVTKVVPPGAYLEVFSKQFDAGDTDIDDLRRQLAALILKVEGLDIYNNRLIVERNLDWFAKYSDNR